MNSSIKVVGAVIFDDRKDKVFVGQRSRLAKLPFKWEFIGGKVNDGEDLFDATEREFLEETQIKVKAKKVIDKESFDYGGEVGEVEVYFIECEKFNSDPKIDKKVYEKVKWISRKDLLDFDWLEADLHFVIKLQGLRKR